MAALLSPIGLRFDEKLQPFSGLNDVRVRSPASSFEVVAGGLAEYGSGLRAR